jgi:hypothetical protein
VADRTVAVTLKAQVLDFVAGMEQAASATSRCRVGRGRRDRRRRPRDLVIKASTEFGAKMAQLQSLSHASAAR